MPATSSGERVSIALADCGVHAFDLVAWFAGAPGVNVQGHAVAAGTRNSGSC